MKARARWLGCAAMAVSWLAGCSASPPPQKPRVTVPRYPGLSVTLIWTAPVDLDLYLAGPTREAAHFGSPVTHTGVRLRNDAGCRDLNERREALFETAGSARPVPGRYRIGVDFLDPCQTRPDRPVPFRLAVRFGDMVEEIAGVAQLGTLSSPVAEFVIAGEPLSLRRVTPSHRPSLIVPAARMVTR